MPFKKGESGNLLGRPKGVDHAVNILIKEAFALLLEKNVPKFSKWLDEVAEKDPKTALYIAIEVSERFVPKLSRTELTGKDGGEIEVIQIPKYDSQPRGKSQP